MLDLQCPNEGIKTDPGSLMEDIQYNVKHSYEIKLCLHLICNIENKTLKHFKMTTAIGF